MRIGGRWAARARRVTGLLLAAGLAASGAARAEVGGVLSEDAAAGGRVTGQQHPFGFLSSATTPSAGVVSLGYAYGAGSGIPADRPLPVDVAAGAGGSHTLSLGYGLTGQVSPVVTASFAQSAASPGRLTTTAQAGLTWQVTRPDAPLHVALTGAAAWEGATGTPGAVALLAAGYERGPLFLAVNLRADRMFAAGRDSVDLFTMAGASLRVWRGLRVGAEYVGQDLEDAFEADLEGGARHALGPSLALDLDRGRYQLTVAAGFGLNARSADAVVRAGFTASY